MDFDCAGRNTARYCQVERLCKPIRVERLNLSNGPQGLFTYLNCEVESIGSAKRKVDRYVDDWMMEANRSLLK